MNELMPRFTHHRPEDLGEILELLSRYGDGALVIAGGTDLVPRMRGGHVRPEHLVSVNGLSELDAISFDEGAGLQIGAGVRIAEVGRHVAVVERYPALAHACSVMATPQVRNMGTVAGNLANGSPCADTASPLLVCDADVLLLGPDGPREVALKDFYQGPRQVDVRSGEIVVAISAPAPLARSGSAYERLSARSRVDMAAVGVAGLVALDEEGRVETARLALTAVAPTPMRCLDAEAILVGEAPAAELLSAAAESCSAASRPIDDVRASAAYRRHLVGVLAGRVLDRCVSLAREGGAS
jgi:aerobic carbon-monoxide dehydrogenase medium subunit